MHLATFAAGGVLLILATFIWLVEAAPICQRNEARKEVRRLKGEEVTLEAFYPAFEAFILKRDAITPNFGFSMMGSMQMNREDRAKIEAERSQNSARIREATLTEYHEELRASALLLAQEYDFSLDLIEKASNPGGIRDLLDLDKEFNKLVNSSDADGPQGPSV